MCDDITVLLNQLESEQIERKDVLPLLFDMREILPFHYFSHFTGPNSRGARQMR